MRSTTTAWILALSPLAACGDDAEPKTDATIATDSSATATTTSDTSDATGEIDATVDPGFEPVAGWLHLTEQRSAESGDDGYPRTLIKFYTEAPPFMAEVARIGECRLLTYENSFCDPFCEWSEVCVDGACVPFPAGVDVGTVTITGRETTVFEPIRDSDNFYSTNDYPEDLFVAGSTVTVEASGGDLQPFTLAATGPIVIESPLRTASAPLLDEDADFIVTWTPAEPASRVRVALHPHGPHGVVENAVIECDSPDDGEVVVDKSLWPQFLVGWGGCGECPSSTLVRYHRDVTTVDGKRIELIVGSQIDFYLQRDLE